MLAGAGIVVALVLYVLPATLASGSGPQRVSSEGEARTALLQASGGALLAVGLYLTWATLRLNREGLVTDRFTRAIDQIGSGTTDVRVGGIYALERIARDSRDYHPAIVEILAAFIREHSRTAPETPPGGATPRATSCGTLERPSPRVDVQAAVTVLGRRRLAHDAPGSSVDLTGACLQGARLEAAQLQRAVLKGADLGGARLDRAQLVHADLTRARLVRAVLWGADLRDATFSGADLGEASMGNALLHGATLVTARLDEATLERARADDETSWPKTLDAEERGVIIEPVGRGTIRSRVGPGDT